MFCMVADENRQKQGKYVEKKDRRLYFFCIISPYTSYNKWKHSTSERERNFLFTSVSFNKYNSAVSE